MTLKFVVAFWWATAAIVVMLDPVSWVETVCGCQQHPQTCGYPGCVAVLPPEVEKAGAAGRCHSDSAPSPSTNPGFSLDSGGLCAALPDKRLKCGRTEQGRKMNLLHLLFCMQRTSKALMEKPFYIFHQSSCSDLAG